MTLYPANPLNLLKYFWAELTSMGLVKHNAHNKVVPRENISAFLKSYCSLLLASGDI